MQDKWGREKSESYERAAEFAHLDGNDALVMVKVHVVGGGRGRYGDRRAMMSMMRSRVSVGSACSHSAITPLTMGADIDVPLATM